MSKRLLSLVILLGPLGISLIPGLEIINTKSLAVQSIDPVSGSDFETALLAQNTLVSDYNSTFNVLVTAYSSSLDETDDTPFTTASGTNVRLGVAAANFLAIGAKFRLPDIFGEQVFTVEDRLHSRYNDRVDIWFETKEEAKKFGYKISRLELIE
jgi:3D (Asp-Asp-Asp) domain-containing protein